MTRHVFTGFGFGPIQGGLFLNEAFASGNFARLVVAEIDPKLVEAVRGKKGSYAVNIARHDGIEVRHIDGVEIFNPGVDTDRQQLLTALAESTEITTSLPAVKFFTMGGDQCVASLIARGLRKSTAPGVLVYTGENHNHAAEILAEAVQGKLASGASGVPAVPVQYFNTVIGKMSRVVTDPAEIAHMRLQPIAPGIPRAFLVEAFNRILVTRCRLAGFTPGIRVFLEKDDLLPFEEAKLYGHNAIHALLAYLGAIRGYTKMTELKDDGELMTIARDAFLRESGAALIRKHAALGDPLFTPAGYRAYAEDLLERMTNPFLEDTVDRAGRDPVRKLGYTDRIFGTMMLALDQGIAPTNMALGAMAGLATLLRQAENNKLPEGLAFEDWRNLSDTRIAELLTWLWRDHSGPASGELIALVQQARSRLSQLC